MHLRYLQLLFVHFTCVLVLNLRVTEGHPSRLLVLDLASLFREFARHHFILSVPVRRAYWDRHSSRFGLRVKWLL